MRKRVCAVLPVSAAVALVWVVLSALRTGYAFDPGGASVDRPRVLLPTIFALDSQSPVGVYDCLEYEFGLIWTSEVVALNPDGSSLYEYGPPYVQTVTGTWAYVPATREVQFTNFRWPTATYRLPDRLWAWRYLPGPGFDIALSCGRRPY